MGLGYLKAEVHIGEGALPVADAAVIVKNTNGVILYELSTNENGNTETVALEAPDIEHTLDPNDGGPYFAIYDVEISHPGYDVVIIHNVQIFDTETSILPVTLTPLPRQRSTAPFVSEYTVTDNYLHSPDDRAQPGDQTASPKILRDVIIPDYITVHLGTPNAAARDVRVKFIDYIKNVASSEIYPTCA